MKSKLIWSFPLILLIYSFFSFTLTDPNLVLSSHPFYWNLQQWLWQIGFHNRQLLSLGFAAIITLLFVSYAYIIKLTITKKLSYKTIKKLIIVSVLALLFSYPALSHDVFNYLFNAKMVLKYHANPHQKVALDFYYDPDLKYMHNTHTTAPYGYGFTALSLIPSLLGFENLKLTVMLFRLLMIGSYFSVLFLHLHFSKPKDKSSNLVLFALNPLILIEIIGNIHNDLVMMALLLLALMFGSLALYKKQFGYWLLAIVLFALSFSIKYATIAFFGGLLMYGILNLLKFNLSFGATQALAHLTPLLISRSQRYLPWYLSWSLSFIPLIKENYLKEFLTISSFAALLSYIPYLYRGEYTDSVQTLRTMICFIPPLSFLFTRLILQKLWPKKPL